MHTSEEADPSYVRNTNENQPRMNTASDAVYNWNVKEFRLS